MHGQTQVELWISSVFCVLFVFWGTEIDENGVPGPVRNRVGIQTPQKTKKIESGKRCGRAFWGHFGTFGEAVFYVFLGTSLFRSWAPFGRPKWQKGCQKGAKSDEKGRPKPCSGTCEKHGRHCTGGILGGPGEGPGRTFFKTLRHGLSRRAPGGLEEDFL